MQGADDSYSEAEDSVFRLLVSSVGGAIGTVSRYDRCRLISAHQAKHRPQAVTCLLGTLAANARCGQ